MRALSDADAARLLREYVEQPEGVTYFAARYGVSRRTVYRVLRRQACPHVPEPKGLTEVVARKSEAGLKPRRLQPAEVEALRHDRAAGMPYSAICRKYHIGHDTARKIVTGETYKDAPGPRETPVSRCRPAFTRAQRLRLATAFLTGVSMKALARTFETTPQFIAAEIRRAGADLDRGMQRLLDAR